VPPNRDRGKPALPSAPTNSELTGAKTKTLWKKGLKAFCAMGFTLKTVKSLIGIGLMSFDPCGRIFLAEQGFQAD
jgi:hypothetical protein